MTFGVGFVGTCPKSKKIIQKYKGIGTKEINIYFPFKFTEDNFNLEDIKVQSVAKKILLWIKQEFKVHIHTEQEGKRSENNLIPTYLGSDKSQDTVERVKAIIDFMKKLEGDIKKEGENFGVVEVHSTEKSNISNKDKYEETLIKNLNKLSDHAKSKGYKIGIEYGKKETLFKRDVIESIWDKNKHSLALNSDVKLIFDVELCYKDVKTEKKLVEFFNNNIDKIVQIHWNNWNTKPKRGNGSHRPLFCYGGTISERTLHEIALKAKEEGIESNLWECSGALYRPEYKKDLDFLKHYFGKKD